MPESILRDKEGTDEGAWLTEDAIHAELWYPRNEGSRKKVTVGMTDVRAADDITIQYDFDRDGWSITREVKRDAGWYMEDTGVWVEAAFIPAWTEEALDA